MFTELEHRENPILKYFKYDQLPNNLREISMPFTDMARFIILNVPASAERTVGLRKLLESKDAVVRAAIP